MSESHRRNASVLARLSLIPPALALLFVIAHGGFGLGRDTTPKIHDLRNPAGCGECHQSETDSRLLSTQPAMCYRCHEDARAHGQSLPLGQIVGPGSELPTAPPVGETLTCTSCHDPHGKVADPQLLRGG